MDRTVTLSQQGREGRVTYSEGPRSISGYQEFGGSGVLAIVSMGSVEDWLARHAWALERRAQILRYIADELVRQQAPGAAAAIDEPRGEITLRAAKSGTAGAAPERTWVRRYGEVKGKAGLIGLALLLAFGAAMWVKTRVLVVPTAKSVPIGSTVRTPTHLATLIDHRHAA